MLGFESNQHAQVQVNSPMPSFAKPILAQSTAIESWFRRNWLDTPAPFYASCDLRNAGFKVTPVDTNLFPAGFNNLSADAAKIAIIALQGMVQHYCPDAARVLIVAENHTRNISYLKNVKSLQNLLALAGFETRVSNLSTDLTTEQPYDLGNGEVLTLSPLERHSDRICIGDFVPCVVLLNNDLSDADFQQLLGLQQYVLPAIELGWHQRTKVKHFDEYRKVVEEFASEFAIDTWQLLPQHQLVRDVDFASKQKVEELIAVIQQQQAQTAQQYQQRQLQATPFVVAKANAGTYGMGVMSITDADTLRQVNRKTRNKMKVGKGGKKITDLLVQEGVPSFEVMAENDAVAEPVVYMINHFVVGGFYRVHQGRGG